MPRRSPALLVSLLATAGTGCGAEMAATPDLDVPEAPQGKQRVLREGIDLEMPGNWRALPERGDRKVVVISGTATLAVWRYEREEPLPDDRLELQRARDALVEQIRERDRGFRLASARTTTLDGRPAIEIRGRGRIGARRMRIRSVHAFFDGAETVIDAYAEPADFARVDRDVFRPALASLRLKRER